MVLTPVDYAVILGYIVAITLFGSWFARFQKTTRDYFLTDQSVPGWANCCLGITGSTAQPPISTAAPSALRVAWTIFAGVSAT